jgi:hypothetical protein
MQVINFKTAGDNVIVPGLAEKSITVTKLALAALAPVKVYFKNGTQRLFELDVTVQAQDFNDFLPVTLRAGDAFVLSTDDAVGVGGFAETEQA